MNNTNWDIRPVQKAVLEIFRAFESICDSNGLKYFAMAGTALGAVRHKGFIPWDDDLDVLMPREDFIRFRQMASSTLPAHLKFVYGGDGGGLDSSPYMGKIYDMRSGIADQLSRLSNLRIDHPPFIDVFVLDGVPPSADDLGKWRRARLYARAYQIFYEPNRYHHDVYHSFKYFVRFWAFRFLGFIAGLFIFDRKCREDLSGAVDFMAMRWPYNDAFIVSEFSFYRKRLRRLTPKYVFGDGRRVPFEDGTIVVPERVDEYLMRQYGDYMKLPPVEQRIPEHALGYQGGVPTWDPE